MSSLLVFGAGGHGKVVAETAKSSGEWNRIAFVDDKYPGLDEVAGFAVIGSIEDGMDMKDSFSSAIVAIGDNSLRVRLAEELFSGGFNVPVILHPTAVVAETASIGRGSVVLANSVVQSNASLGRSVILNTLSSIDHDCQIGNGVHLSPGTHLGGDVRIGDNTFLGVGVSVIRGIEIGGNTVIGGGAVVVKNIEPNIVAFGVPAEKAGDNE